MVTLYPVYRSVMVKIGKQGISEDILKLCQLQYPAVFTWHRISSHSPDNGCIFGEYSSMWILSILKEDWALTLGPPSNLVQALNSWQRRQTSNQNAFPSMYISFLSLSQQITVSLVSQRKYVTLWLFRLEAWCEFPWVKSQYQVTEGKSTCLANLIT